MEKVTYNELKQILKKNNLSKKWLSDKMSITESAISDWSWRGIPARRQFHILELIKEENLIIPEELQDEFQPNYLKPQHNSVAVEILDQGFAAGQGQYPQDQEFILGTNMFNLTWMKKKGLQPSNLKIISVVGDSMEPKINDKDACMIELDSQPRSGHPVAFRINNELLIKNYQPRGDGKIEFSSNNTAYNVIVVDPKNPPQDFQIIGRIVWHAHSYV